MSVIYVQFKKHIVFQDGQPLRLSDVINVVTDKQEEHTLDNMIVDPKQTNQIDSFVIDGLLIIRLFKKHFPNVTIRFIGPTYTFVYKKRKSHPFAKTFVPLIWLLLFIGTAMTIMNFHHDVGMQEVQQKLHYIITGKENKYPLLLQIPYSIGLGVGMILFFNYWFTKRFNKEPSPLDIELFKYEQDLEQFKYQKMFKNNDSS